MTPTWFMRVRERVSNTALPFLLLVGGVGVLLIFTGALAGSDLLTAGEPTPQPTPTSWPLETRLASPDYGVNIHMWWDPWSSIRRDWTLIEEAGFRWVKQRLAWQDVEGAGPGRWSWQPSDRIVDEAEQAGLNVIFRIDHPPSWALATPVDDEPPETPVDLDAFGDFCYALADRYRGRVRGYQIWNEPNLAREWAGRAPNPIGYVKLLETCYVNIKRADPDALVISAGLAPTGSAPPEAIPDTEYLVAMYEAGASPYFDLLGLHAPGYKAPPEIPPEVAANPEAGYGGHAFFCFRHAEDMREIMEAYGDGHKQVAILEFGWHTNTSPEHPDYAWFAVTPEEQADYLVRAYEYAEENWSPWVGPMFVWNFPDSKWTPENEEFWWSIVDPFWWEFDRDFESWGGAGVRPAYEALKEMEKR